MNEYFRLDFEIAGRGTVRKRLEHLPDRHMLFGKSGFENVYSITIGREKEIVMLRKGGQIVPPWSTARRLDLRYPEAFSLCHTCREIGWSETYPRYFKIVSMS